MAKIRNISSVPVVAADPKRPGVERVANSASGGDSGHPVPSIGGGST